ncbi:acyl-CoA dehydrogenase family protein [Streptomyces sp. NPDC002896]|uniref:acyl-CoA dehydrogenase family protein n=1 Tax=Streptomyces sp. NPDC002896 TaxID=3154438 RepID=UPI00332C0BAE
MEAEEFRLVREALRAFAARYRCASAEAKPADRAAAQQALDALGLAELRASTPPSATAQECALLAEEHGRYPLATSFLGTVLLAPELLRLLEADGGPVAYEGVPTVALARDLRFAGCGTTDGADLVGWDCQGADGALWVADDGTVRWSGLGVPTPTTDSLRTVRALRSDAPPTVLGRLDAERRQYWQAWALVMVTSELVGAARSFLAQSTDYARERTQYGRAIGSFQAVQHLLADATVAVEACTSAVRYAAWCLDHASPEAALAAARVAKAEANESAVEAVYTGMQVFGGIAQTWEHTAHLYLRRVLLGATVLARSADLLPVLAAPAQA